MNFDEFKNILKNDRANEISSEIVENAIGAFKADPVACAKLGNYY